MTRQGQRGFSIMEMLGVCAIIGLIFMTVGPLIDESTAIVERSGAAARTAPPEQLGAMLRADLEAGRIAGEGVGAQVLELSMPSGGSVRWALAGRTLRREERDARGVVVGRAFRHFGVTNFVWQPVSGELVEVRLAWREASLLPPGPGMAPERRSTAAHQAVWRVARRGGKEGLSW